LIILFLGTPGAGKTTLAKFVSEKLNLPLIDVGEILRRLAEQDPALAQEMNSGELADEGEVDRIVFTKIHDDDYNFILDGFPRTLTQAQALTHLLNEHGHRIDHVFEVTAPPELLKARILARGRADDTEKVIDERLEIYDRETRPVLDFLKTRDHKVIKLDNSGPLPDTEKELRGSLNLH